MIQQTLKIIWAERKINIWILFELVLVFCILWFCVDYVYFFTKRYLEPTGYGVEHVYNINLGVKEDGFDVINNGSDAQKDSLLSKVWTIIDRIERYPDVENVSISFAAMPYSRNYMSNNLTLDSVTGSVQFKTVTPEYFEVFGIGISHGKVSDWSKSGDIIISGDRENLFLKKNSKDIESLVFDEESKRVIGVAEPTKRFDLGSFSPIMYMLLSKSERETIVVESSTEICVRVKAGSDKGFAEKFTKDMQEQLALDPYFLSSVISFREHRSDFINWYGYSSDFKSIFSISAFLLINIFLAVVGTFWFRTQARRSEIGLRVAVGASRKDIRMIFILETILLIFIASIVATVVCINVGLVDILKEIDLPSVDRSSEEIGIGQYFINYGFTFLILALISVLAVWYPARKASKTQPAEALKDE